MKEYLTVSELQEKLKVSRQTIYDWRKNGLPFLKIGSSIRFDGDEVNEWVEKQNKVTSE